MRVHWSYPYWRNIWYTLQLFSRFLAIKKYSCIGMLSIAIFYIPRWRYLHITLDHIFSCCVSCNGLSIGIITIYVWNSLGNIFHQSLWKLKFKRTKQTETFFLQGRRAAGAEIGSRIRWLSCVKAGFLGTPLPQRGLESKNQRFRVSRGFEEQEERKEKKNYTESLVAIYKSKIWPIPVHSSFCIKLIWLKIKIYWKM